MRFSSFMDASLRCWTLLGNTFRRRPAMVVGMLIGMTILLSTQAYLLTTQPEQERKINNVVRVTCDPQHPDLRCQRLLDALLNNTTPEQRQTLREIAGTR